MSSGGVSDTRDDQLVRLIFDRLRDSVQELGAAGLSVLGGTIGLATGASGEAIYRLSLTEAARIAADVADDYYQRAGTPS